MKVYRPLFTVFLLLTTFSAFSQQVEMADQMRANGKIYVVVGIILIVLTGFILYLFTQDRKLSRIEKLIREKENQAK
jgi:hypothetical protein